MLQKLLSLALVGSLILCLVLGISTYKYRSDYYEAKSEIVELEGKNKVLEQNVLVLNEAILTQNQHIDQLAKDSESYLSQLSDIQKRNAAEAAELDTAFDTITVTTSDEDLIDWMRKQAIENQ